MFPAMFFSMALPLLLLAVSALPTSAATPAKDDAKKNPTAFEFNKKDPIYITADWMETDQTKNSITYKGRVVAVQNAMTMRSETLTA